MSNAMKPIIVVGAGPVGLTTALGLDFYRLPFLLFEDDAELSRDTKAGAILTRTLEAFRRYRVADEVLAKALRVDEIGDVERATNTARPSVQTALLSDDTRYPFVINMNVYCDRLDHLIERLGVKTIAPTHGLPITDVQLTVPKVQEGLKAAALMPESGTNEKVPLTGAAAATSAA